MLIAKNQTSLTQKIKTNTLQESTSELKSVPLSASKFQESLSYLSHLHQEGQLSDRAYDLLSRYICSVFIEQRVETKVFEVLQKRLFQF